LAHQALANQHGARAALGAQAALVVMCGTATTIDLLTATGHFTGGVILPGLALMVTVLHERTAALPRASGHVVAHPDCTADAIASGCLHAQAGAIERLWHLHRSAHEPLTCLLAGGAAHSIGPFLTVPYRLREDLVLLGLATIADSLSASSLPNTSS
jgi:type III pantothenate kinase